MKILLVCMKLHLPKNMYLKNVNTLFFGLEVKPGFRKNHSRGGGIQTEFSPFKEDWGYHYPKCPPLTAPLVRNQNNVKKSNVLEGRKME